ncbi:MAG: methanogenesis marker 16 metalloprotein [Methanomicrobiaceae archaeon]|nr:methanogenesis marker 16 metalloprotein [Methanomicrobiaceae archaeon]
MVKTVDEINQKIREGNTVVFTAQEFKKKIRDGEILTPEDVDVVTCGTCGVMSGTMAILSVTVAEPGAFRRADSISLNGVPAFPGPCPNEGLGLVDLVVYGTSHASSSYGGGNLFRDLADEKEIEVVAESGGKTFEATIYGDELPYAKMITSRSAFKNYSAFVNAFPDPVSTIFSVTPLSGGLSQATVSGCGEINPLQNDPEIRFLKSGAKVLLNGSDGIILGEGTRSSPDKPNLSVSADMKDMMPEFMGGFRTSAGPECITSIGAAIPVLDERSIHHLSVLDGNIPLPVVDVFDRKTLGFSDYGRIWQDTDHRIAANPMNCLFCGECPALMQCPTNAIMPGGGVISSRCVNCGTCLSSCPGEVYSMNTGSVFIDGKEIPVVLRQSDRNRGEKICSELKQRIEDSLFFIGGV